MLVSRFSGAIAQDAVHAAWDSFVTDLRNLNIALAAGGAILAAGAALSGTRR